jgi:hypothetical protein
VKTDHCDVPFFKEGREVFSNSTAPLAFFNAAGADDYESLAEGYAATLPLARESELSALVGVPVDRLRPWSIGWCEPKRQYTIGVRAADGAMIGVMLWNGSGYRSIGRAGLILPPYKTDCRGRSLFVTAGACNTLSVAELQQPVVGLSSPLAAEELSAFVERQKPAEVVVLQNGIKDPLLSLNGIPTLLREQGWLVAVVTPPDGIGGFVARRRHGATFREVSATVAEFSQEMAGANCVAA